MSKTPSSGTVHKTPLDIKRVIIGNQKLRDLWQDITPLARNEWICWIISAKKLETRTQRLAQMQSKLLAGKRRPCCWAGCPHRERNGY